MLEMDVIDNITLAILARDSHSYDFGSLSAKTLIFESRTERPEGNWTGGKTFEKVETSLMASTKLESLWHLRHNLTLYFWMNQWRAWAQKRKKNIKNPLKLKEKLYF